MERTSSRELAYCGVFGAAAMLLPVLFHLVHLGRIFMPMYLPLLTLAFFVGPRPAAVTAAMAPLLSGAITGMPPFYPPTAPMMAVELPIMASIIALVVRSWPRANEWAVLAAVLLLGRCIYATLSYFVAVALGLPPVVMTAASFFSGWPGLVLMLAVVPPIVRTQRRPRAESKG